MILSLCFTIMSLISYDLPYDQGKLSKVKVGENITMKIPEDFFPMSEDDIQQRISSHRKSLALYTDYQRVIELGVNRSFTKWEQEDLELLKDFYKSSLLEIYDEVEFYKEGVYQINKQTFVVFEFRSLIKGDSTTPGMYNSISKYTYLMYTIYEGDTYVFNFICPFRLKDDWSRTADEIMTSVSFK